MVPGKNSRHRNEPIRAHPVKDADCTAFLQWALPRLGMRWPGFRRVRGQVCKRLRRRMAELGLRNLAAYRALLETHSGEWVPLDGLCRISISRFYRDQGVWRTLEREVLPPLGREGTGTRQDRASDLERRLRQGGGTLFPGHSRTGISRWASVEGKCPH